MPPKLQDKERVSQAVRHYLKSCGLLPGSRSTGSNLVKMTSELSLKNLEAWERSIREELWSNTGAIAAVKAVVRMQLWTQLDAWLGLCSGDGFERERALKHLSAGAPNGFFFSLLARRLNDWVAQVRKATRLQMGLIAAQTNPEFVVDALWSTLPHLHSWSRMGEMEQQTLLELLSISTVAECLTQRIQNAVTGPATTILTQAGQTPALDRWLPELARDSLQPAVRAKAYKTLLERRAVWSTGREWKWTSLQWCKGRLEHVFGERPVSVEATVSEILQWAIADKSPRVRRVAGDYLIQSTQSGEPTHQRFIEALACDPNASVAERGRFARAKTETHPHPPGSLLAGRCL